MAIPERPAGISSWSKSQMDRLLSPATRQHYYATLRAFANEYPLLFTFLLLQCVFSFTPVALFLTFTLGTLAFSIITAILFSLFWIGMALLLLVPTLFLTVSVAIVVWIWAVSSFLISRWIYSFVPVSVKGGAEVSMPNGKKLVVEKTGQGYGDLKGEVKDGN